MIAYDPSIGPDFIDVLAPDDGTILSTYSRAW
jgi:hypothetical protein